MLLVLAAIALEHENFAKAQELCGVAATIGGAEGWRHVIEGRLALARRDTEAARRSARAAQSAGIEFDAVAGDLGVLLARTGLHGEAVPHFERAAAAAPGDAQTAYNLAIARQFGGDLDGARAAFTALVGKWPDHAPAWLALVGLGKQDPAQVVPILKRGFDRAEDAETRLTFGHAIARVLEDDDQWPQSLVWLDRAKRDKRAAVAHDRAATDALFAEATAAADKLGPLPQSGGDPAPLFIVGLPRSGTTLVERILTAHPAIASAGELSDFAVLLKQASGTAGPLVLDPATIARGASVDPGAIEADYVSRLRAIAGDASARVIDKMPFNLFFVPAILRALPGARVICLRRDPRDAVFSNYRQLFATGFTYYSYAYDLEDTAHFVAGFERLADHYAHTLPADRFRTQHYEDVVADLETEARGLIAFAGLEWDDACLAFHENAAPVATASSVQVRQPLYSKAVARWRRYGAGAERAVNALKRLGITFEDD